MTKRSLTRKLAAAAASALAMVTVADTSATAGSTTIVDPSGVDYDAACVVADPLAPTPPPNSIPSPGAPGGSLGVPLGGSGCNGVSLYDGSTASTDIRSVSLSTNGVSSGPHSNTQLVATCELDRPLPSPGSTTHPALGSIDLPNDGLFLGAGCKVMFQNRARQTNAPYVAATRMFTGTPLFGLNEHRADGFHFWIGFDVDWNGARWLHSAKIGTYDPSPAGGFLFQELGVSTSPGVWNTTDPCMPHGATWNVAYGPGNKVTVTVDGVSRSSSTLAVGGCINEVHVKTGDTIVDVSGLTSADVFAVLPVIVPTSLIPGFADITTTGGVMSLSDVTEGNSRNVGIVGAVLQRNISGISYTPGLARRANRSLGQLRNAAAAGESLDVRPDGQLSGVGASMPDTLRRGPRCWTPTFGGLLPSNPLWVPNQPCHVDDDSIPGPTGNIDPGERGTFLPEFWNTAYGFTA